ncbi:MAG: hypothetical protein ACLQVN_03330 [Bryobacteraceae bacterium]
MTALLRGIRAAWNAVRGTEWRLQRLDRVELIWIQRQYERTAREERFPFV